MSAEHHAGEFFNSLYVLLVLVNSRPVNCESLMELGQSSTSVNYSRFPEACLKRRSSVSPCISECYFWSFRSFCCLLRTILVSIFVDNFYNAFFWQRLVRNDGLDSVCQNSFLRCGQVNSALCILLRSSMNLMIHLPRFFVSVITSASLASLSRQIVHLPL